MYVFFRKFDNFSQNLKPLFKILDFFKLVNFLSSNTFLNLKFFELFFVYQFLFSQGAGISPADWYIFLEQYTKEKNVEILFLIFNRSEHSCKHLHFCFLNMTEYM
jgi:hypothetical protein